LTDDEGGSSETKAERRRSQEKRASPLRETSFLPGDLVANRYEVLRLLGKGGMGEVYAVRDRELQTDVALKFVRSDRAETEGGSRADRLRREVFLARQVTHKNVCRIYELGTHDGRTGSCL